MEKKLSQLKNEAPLDFTIKGKLKDEVISKVIQNTYTSVVGGWRNKNERCHSNIPRGNSYLIKDHSADSAYKLFRNEMECGFRGLCITRTNPSAIKEKCGLDAQTIWLGSPMPEKIYGQSDLKNILSAISNFMKNNIDGILLLERVDYLINVYSFEETLKFIYALNDLVTMNNSVMLLHINPALLTNMQLSMIEQEVQKVPELGEKTPELTDDLQEIIDFIINQKSINKTVSFKEVTRKFNITKSTARRRINKLQALNLVNVRKNGRLKILSLVEKR